MIAPELRQTTAYWLTLAYRLSGVPRREVNGLVLVADREEHLGLVDLVRHGTEGLPEKLARFRAPLAALIAAEPQVSAQAFLVDQLLEAGVRVLPITDPAYPAHLARALTPSRSPTVLTVVGEVGLLAEQGVAVSGSRNASPASLRFARAVGRALAEAGVTVVSGLARGVDTEALLGALEAGGRVIGVAAEGILKNVTTRRPEIREGRLAVVSQFEPAAQWRGSLAMERNQTIAGFSRALVIADCVAEGGTTNQFEVHRKLGMPVFVRRGPGEGALVADLAMRPGAAALRWDTGPVPLPAVLRGSTGAPVGCEVRQDGEQLVFTVRAPAGPTREAILAAITAAWPSPASSTTASETHTADAYGPGPAAAASPDPADEAVFAALHAAAEPLTVRDLASTTGEAEARMRRRLERLVEVGRVAQTKKGRAKAYRAAASAPATAFRPGEGELPLLAAQRT